MRKGSVTIFSLLSMMLVASALFALLEAGRYQEIRRLADLQTQSGLESVFAEYNTYLWEEYRLLACKQDDVCETFTKISNSRLVDSDFGTNFFQFEAGEIELKGYTRLTDGDGRAYIQAVSEYMEENLMYEVVKTIYNQYEGMKDIQMNSGFDFSIIDQALDKMEENNSTGSTGMLQQEIELEDIEKDSMSTDKRQENLLEVIKQLQKKGILSLVIEDTSQLSEKKMDISEVVSKRELAKAYNPRLEEADWYDRILLQQYFLTYMSNYREEKNHGMSYELEYLLGGKASDVENMKAVVNQLLGIREAANFLYLINNPIKVEQAYLLAVGIAGISVSPMIVEIVKMAVLSAWAFAESILDIRTLLTGGKIAILKSDSTWTMDLDYISTIGEDYTKAKNCKDGLCYKDYLGILLMFQQENEVAKRGMDVQELTLREKYESEEICLDEWIVDVELGVTYEYEPVFFSIESMLPFWNYEIYVREQYEY